MTNQTLLQPNLMTSSIQTNTISIEKRIAYALPAFALAKTREYDDHPEALERGSLMEMQAPSFLP
jgi:alpha-D-ribose 1-methylphosphonate 5-phosphate C-P lyase